MTYETPITATQNYLLSRLRTANCAKDGEGQLRAAFKLDQPYPKTVGEAKAKLAAGQYTFRNHEGTDIKDDTRWPMDWLSWYAPGEKPDVEGYEQVRNVIHKDATKVMDVIYVKSPEEALTALNEFEAKTYH